MAFSMCFNICTGKYRDTHDFSTRGDLGITNMKDARTKGQRSNSIKTSIERSGQIMVTKQLYADIVGM